MSGPVTVCSLGGKRGVLGGAALERHGDFVADLRLVDLANVGPHAQRTELDSSGLSRATGRFIGNVASVLSHHGVVVGGEMEFEST